MTDDGGKSKGFGFVSFERHEDAQKVRSASYSTVREPTVSFYTRCIVMAKRQGLS